MNFPNQISGTFNRNITLGVGNLKVYKDNALFLTFTESSIEVVNNVFTIDIRNLFPDNGDYFITFTEGLFKSGVQVYKGITNPSTWTFSIVDGEYESTEYNNEFLID
jgi:hypothetical protein